MKLTWDESGQRLYETGVDRGVLYPQDDTGIYPEGYAWNGLTSVSESPSGGEATDLFADNIKYLSLMSTETYGATIEAYTYPKEFEECDGSAEIAPGVMIGQQNRKSFGFSYRSLVGDDIKGTDLGYKIHILYGCKASPSERQYSTVSDSPDAITFSWEISTTPVPIEGFKAAASLTIDTTKATPAKIQALEAILYGSTDVAPRLPLPAEIMTLMAAG